MSDNPNVNHPSHYGGKDNPYEAIKVIEAWKLNFNLGNAVKYISRHEHKGVPLQDLEKALWYLQRDLQGDGLLSGQVDFPEDDLYAADKVAAAWKLDGRLAGVIQNIAYHNHKQAGWGRAVLEMACLDLSGAIKERQGNG